MRIGIVGAGAIGGYLAVRLIAAGHAVSVIARGTNLATIASTGLCLRHTDGSEQWVQPALATNEPALAGPQDVLILAVKAHQLPAAVVNLAPMLHAQTLILPAQNGIPWWYFQKHGGRYDGRMIHAVDPDGVIAAHIPTEQVIGCVVYPATELVAPGVIQHIEGDRLPVGELDGSRTERIQQLSQMLVQAGIKAPIRPRIRSDIWIKLWGNLAFNPLSALTRATLGQMIRYEPSRTLIAQLMAEAQAIAETLGISFGITIDQRIAGAEQVGEHKTSMLQDVEAGRPTEIEALLGAVAELGQLTEISTPHIDTVLAAMRLMERVRF